MSSASWALPSLSVFVFAAPALLGTRQGAKLGLFTGGPALSQPISATAPMPSICAHSLRRHRTTSSPVVRLVQPMIDQTAKMDNDADRAAIFEKHLKLSVEPPKEGGPQTRHHRLAGNRPSPSS